MRSLPSLTSRFSHAEQVARSMLGNDYSGIVHWRSLRGLRLPVGLAAPDVLGTPDPRLSPHGQTRGTLLGGQRSSAGGSAQDVRAVASAQTRPHRPLQLPGVSVWDTSAHSPLAR